MREARESYLDSCLYLRGLSPKTIEAYRIDLVQFECFLKAEFSLPFFKNVDREMLQSYMIALHKKYKPKTVKRKVAALKAFFSYLDEEELISINPFSKLKVRVKEPKQLPAYLEIEEVKSLLEAVETQIQVHTNKSSLGYKAAVRDKLVIELLFATGIRVSELSGLQWGDIDRERSIIRVMGKGNKERHIPFGHPPTIRALSLYIRAWEITTVNNGPVFINREGERLSSQSIRLLIRKYSKLAKLKKHVTPHTLRHTFATLLLEEGVDIRYIQQILGHSSIMVTQIYTHVSKRKQEELLSTHHPRRRMKV